MCTGSGLLSDFADVAPFAEVVTSCHGGPHKEATIVMAVQDSARGYIFLIVDTVKIFIIVKGGCP